MKHKTRKFRIVSVIIAVAVIWPLGHGWWPQEVPRGKFTGVKFGNLRPLASGERENGLNGILKDGMSVSPEIVHEITYDQIKMANHNSPLEVRTKAVYTALVALQFKRFVLGEGKLDPEQTYDKYERALTLLIDKMGEDAFIEASKNFFDRDLTHLDFYTTILGKESTERAGHKMHSDLTPQDPHYMELAITFTESVYPIETNMKRYGSLVNTRTIFGDADFWKFLRSNKPSIFRSLIEHMKEWPGEVVTGNMYVGLTIFPRAAVSKYFPEAYYEVQLGDSSFSDDGRQAIIAVKTRERSLQSRGILSSKEDFENDCKWRYQTAKNRFLYPILFSFNRVHDVYMAKKRGGRLLTVEEILTQKSPSSVVSPILERVIDEKASNLDPLELEVFIKRLESYDSSSIIISYDPEQQALEDIANIAGISIGSTLDSIIGQIPYARVNSIVRLESIGAVSKRAISQIEQGI